MGPAQAQAAAALAAAFPAASGVPCATVSADFGASGGADASMRISAAGKGYWEGGFPSHCPKTEFSQVHPPPPSVNLHKIVFHFKA